MTRLCRVFDVTRAGYYAWRQRPASARTRQDRLLLEEMRAIFEQSDRTYGSPRLQRALRGQGYRVSRRRVERLMRVGALRARAARVYRPKAGTHRWFGRQPNYVRRLRVTRPNQIWVADLTYLPAGRRWWFLAIVLDQYSRRVLAWRLARSRTSRLVRRIVEAAHRRRRPPTGLIVHSNRGSEFQGQSLQQLLTARGIRHSMTRGGAPDEHAHVESFFHSLKAECIHGRLFPTVAILRHAVQAYVRYDNHRRLHSSLGYQSPIDYERRAA